jgi:hypothetical protein
MKIHELAKEYNISATDFLKKLTELGFTYHAHTQALSDMDADNIRSVIAKAAKAKDPEQIRIKELSLMTMVGIFYDIATGKYHISSLRILPEEHDKYGVQLSKGYPSINHLTHDLNQMTVDAGFFNPNELQKVRAKQLTDSKK